MFNSINAQRIAGLLGKFRSVESGQVLKQRIFLRVNVELDTTIPVRDGFWWKNSSGEDKWATISYERLADICYGCGRIGHTSTNCGQEVARAESDQNLPRYRSWLTGDRSRNSTKSYRIGGQDNILKSIREGNMQSWKEIMASAWGRESSLPFSGRRSGSSGWSGKEARSRETMQQQRREDHGRNDQRSFVVDQEVQTVKHALSFDLNLVPEQ